MKPEIVDLIVGFTLLGFVLLFAICAATIGWGTTVFLCALLGGVIWVLRTLGLGGALVALFIGASIN